MFGVHATCCSCAGLVTLGSITDNRFWSAVHDVLTVTEKGDWNITLERTDLECLTCRLEREEKEAKEEEEALAPFKEAAADPSL